MFLVMMRHCRCRFTGGGRRFEDLLADIKAGGRIRPFTPRDLPPFPDISQAVVDSLNDVDDEYLLTGSIYLSQLLRGEYRPQNLIFDVTRLDESVQTGRSR